MRIERTWVNRLNEKKYKQLWYTQRDTKTYCAHECRNEKMKRSTKEKNFWNEEWFCTFGVNLKVNALRFGFVIDFHKSYSWVSFSVVVVHTSQWMWSGVVVSMHQVNTKLVHFWEPHSRRFSLEEQFLKEEVDACERPNVNIPIKIKE